MQQQMGDLQPKMQAIQEKHKDDQAKQSEEMMNLLKTQGG
jgi:membrane protein insertase Oxa1/YidC/SpoIIIJ